MKTLGFPDQHYLNFAKGWLELGNPALAKTEADRISVLGRIHQDAFLVRWRIAARIGDWDEALRLTTVFTKTQPKRATGWICRAYSLYQMHRPLEAWMLLLPKAAEFPTLSAIPYVLACFAWHLGNRRLAEQYLAKSAALGGPSVIQDTNLDAVRLSGMTEDGAPGHESPAPPLGDTSSANARFDLGREL